MSTPMRRIRSLCCARAASGHAAAPPTSVMNSRRLIVAPRGQNHAPHRLTAVRVLERNERGANCDQLFSAGECRLCVPRPSQNRKGSESGQMLSALPPKAVPPDLRTTLAASLLRTPPSRPRASAHSRRWECDLRGGRRPASRATASPRGRRRTSRCGRQQCIGEHVVIVIVPLAGWMRGEGAFEDQRYTVLLLPT